MTLTERITKPGPKKILTLDGGGIRGIMTVEVLAGIEKSCRTSKNNPKLVLSDWFDFFAGTSTRGHYRHLPCPGDVNRRNPHNLPCQRRRKCSTRPFYERFRFKYEDEKLAGKLKEVFSAKTTLSDPKLKTLLMMVMRNATTDSPWPLSNNPGAKYNQTDRADCNLNIPL